MPRERLPNRRAAENFEFFHNGHRIIVNVGYYDDGRPGEVFVCYAGKSGSDLNIEMLANSTATSIALQYGAGIAEINAAFPKTEDGRSESVVGHALDILTGPSPQLRPVS